MVKCEACRAFYRLFVTSFNNFNITQIRILYFLYHMTFNVFCNRVIRMKTPRFVTLIVLVHCKSAQVRYAYTRLGFVFLYANPRPYLVHATCKFRHIQLVSALKLGCRSLLINFKCSGSFNVEHVF